MFEHITSKYAIHSSIVVRLKGIPGQGEVLVRNPKQHSGWSGVVQIRLSFLTLCPCLFFEQTPSDQEDHPPPPSQCTSKHNITYIHQNLDLLRDLHCSFLICNSAQCTWYVRMYLHTMHAAGFMMVTYGDLDRFMSQAETIKFVLSH